MQFEQSNSHESAAPPEIVGALGEIATGESLNLSSEPWKLPLEAIDVYTEDVGGFFAGRRTSKQRIVGTDLILRAQTNPDLEPRSEEAEEGLRLFAELDQYPGVNVVPMEVVQGPQLYTIVKEVIGEALPIALQHPTAELIDQYQDSLVGLTKYFVDKYKNGGRYLNDMPARHQRMYGRVNKEEKPQIYLVDTDFAIGEVGPNGQDSQEREHDLLRRSEWLAWDILNTEKSNGHYLGKARDALVSSLSIYPDNDVYNPHREKIMEILANSPLSNGGDSSLPS